MFNSKITALLLVVASMFFVACGPTYYVQPTGQAAHQPAYDPNQFAYDAMLAAAVVNGVNGYYGANHVFYPSVVVGGVPGYYVGGVFHTSQTNRTTVINNYQTEIRTHQTSVNTSKPNYGTNQGTIGRGPSSPTPSASAQTSKPAYSTGGGSMQRSAPTPAPAPRSSFSSSTGSISRRR